VIAPPVFPSDAQLRSAARRRGTDPETELRRWAIIRLCRALPEQTWPGQRLGEQVAVGGSTALLLAGANSNRGELAPRVPNDFDIYVPRSLVGAHWDHHEKLKISIGKSALGPTANAHRNGVALELPNGRHISITFDYLEFGNEMLCAQPVRDAFAGRNEFAVDVTTPTLDWFTASRVYRGSLKDAYDMAAGFSLGADPGVVGLLIRNRLPSSGRNRATSIIEKFDNAFLHLDPTLAPQAARVARQLWKSLTATGLLDQRAGSKPLHRDFASSIPEWEAPHYEDVQNALAAASPKDLALAENNTALINS
jgi:hypothetical protein